MKSNSEEMHRPAEWLMRFDEEPRRYFDLLLATASLAVAAWRLARARCRIRPIPTNVPTSTELWAAAQRLALRVHLPAGLPSAARLAAECEAHGLVVIVPVLAQDAA